MSWLRIDDALADHPKLRDAGPRAAWLFICSLCYCSRYLTDGFVPMSALAGMGGLTDARKLARKVEGAGLWVPGGDGYLIPDYLDYNPSRAVVEAKRAKERQRKTAQPAADSARNTEQVDRPPTPAPTPSPTVVEVVEESQGPEGEESLPASGPPTNGKEPHPARFDHEQSVLLGKILEKRPTWLGRLTPGGVVSLNKDFGYGLVFEAMQELLMRLRENSAGKIAEPYPYLRGMVDPGQSHTQGVRG